MYRKESKSKVDRTMPMVHPNAAAIDVGATMHMAAVGPDHALEPVRSFGTFTADLDQLVKWFVECGVETVVMESTSVYWIPIFELLGDILGAAFLDADVLGRRLQPPLRFAELLIGLKQLHQGDVGRTHKSIPRANLPNPAPATCPPPGGVKDYGDARPDGKGRG